MLCPYGNRHSGESQNPRVSLDMVFFTLPKKAEVVTICDRLRQRDS